ncbi:MAG: Holliday junction resolvase RuvX [Bacteroidales bacterium]|nr:Holliday junction resolvase RuvX [Bacteroidales bacterium]
MGRILAIDYGRKRCGIAVTDPLKLIAHALETVPTSGLEAYLADYMEREEVEAIVVGLPLQMDATPSESARYIEPFVRRLEKRYPHIPIARVDERFTSKMAFQTMIDAGLKKKKRQDKGLGEALSATLILQTYMQNPNKP